MLGSARKVAPPCDFEIENLKLKIENYCRDASMYPANIHSETHECLLIIIGIIDASQKLGMIFLCVLCVFVRANKKNFIVISHRS